MPRKGINIEVGVLFVVVRVGAVYVSERVMGIRFEVIVFVLSAKLVIVLAAIVNIFNRPRC